jgi:1,4-dihydroxy-2-naphthoyl-CoA hydrolase
MALWFANPTIDQLHGRGGGGLASHLGIEFTELGDDYLRGTMPVLPRVHQPMGMLHGGASVALAETLGSVAAFLTLDPRKKRCVGQEINANHLRPVTEGVVTGTAKPFHIGARSHVWGIEIRDARERLICVSRLTVAVIDWKPETDENS